MANAYRGTAKEYVCTDFGADCSSRFDFTAWTDSDTRTHTVTDTADQLNHQSATAGMGL